MPDPVVQQILLSIIYIIISIVTIKIVALFVYLLKNVCIIKFNHLEFKIT